MTASQAAVPRHHTATAYISCRGRTLLLWHRALGMWLPPGGHSEPHETPAETAVREAREESGLAVAVIPPAGLLACSGPRVEPPPAVILVEDIVRADQPFHQHIDHVYFTSTDAVGSFADPVPHGPHRWTTEAELAAAFSLETPDGTLLPVAEDVRLLGARAIAAWKSGHA